MNATGNEGIPRSSDWLTIKSAPTGRGKPVKFKTMELNKNKGRTRHISNAEIAKALLESDGDAMWVGRALLLVEVLEGTSIEPTQPVSGLLNAMTDVQDEHPQVKKFLNDLPGYSQGDRELAEKMLGFLTIQIAAVAA